MTRKQKLWVEVGTFYSDTHEFCSHIIKCKQEDELLRSIVTEMMAAAGDGVSMNHHDGSDGDDSSTVVALVDGGISWSNVAERLGGCRKAKQCRDRWYNQLRPGIKKGNWTKEEEAFLREMFQTFGPK